MCWVGVKQLLPGSHRATVELLVEVLEGAPAAGMDLVVPFNSSLDMVAAVIRIVELEDGTALLVVGEEEPQAVESFLSDMELFEELHMVGDVLELRRKGGEVMGGRYDRSASPPTGLAAPHQRQTDTYFLR